MENDNASRNKFSELRFVACNIAISMEGSAYYNKFDNITIFTCNKCIWLKVEETFIKSLSAYASGVNRNSFYNVNAFACTDGIIIDYGDTNKFVSCSFEWLSGTSVQLYDQNESSGNVLHFTMYNTFIGITNEANAFDLICDTLGNSFIDFDSNFSKVDFLKSPTIYIPSGDFAADHTVLNLLIQPVDQAVLNIKKIRYTQQNHFMHKIFLIFHSLWGPMEIIKGWVGVSFLSHPLSA